MFRKNNVNFSFLKYSEYKCNYKEYSVTINLCSYIANFRQHFLAEEVEHLNYNLGQKICPLFHLLTQFTFLKSEIELDYCH